MPVISSTSQWASLEQHAKVIKELHLKNLLQDAERNKSLTTEFDGITLDYSRQRALPETLDLLCDLANAAGLKDKMAAMQSGHHINETEDRAVMHIALRTPKDFKPIMVDGENVVPAVHAVLDKIGDFASRFRTGKLLGVTGKKLTTVLSIGIGGSCKSLLSSVSLLLYLFLTNSKTYRIYS